MEDLIKNVEYFIEKHELKTKCNRPYYTHRRMYFYSTLRDAGLSYQRIADIFGKNHATVMNGIKRYKQLRATNDKLLYLDIADYDGRFKLHKKSYDLKKDILGATTVRDLDTIKGRVDNNLYKELI